MIIRDVLFPEMIQFADRTLNLLFEQPRKIEILKSYIDNFLKPSNKIYNPIYLNCMNSFFSSSFKIFKLPYCISDLFDLDKIEKANILEE